MNRQWLLAKRPAGTMGPDCFAYHEGADPRGKGLPGQVLVEWELFLCAPTIRNWISGARHSFHPVVDIGAPILAPGVGRIIESNDPRFAVGQRLHGIASWQDQQWITPDDSHTLVDDAMTSVDAIGPFGINPLTAYGGLIRTGQPKAGDVVLVSGAAGSVGSVVVQIARTLGCTVIGIAGGPDKLRWLREDCGIERLIDYKHDDVAAAIDRLAPDGVDIFFDNVGGSILVDAAARMKPGGRIVLCGQIARYDGDGAVTAPPIEMMRLIYGGIRIEGFLIYHHRAVFDQAVADLSRWYASGEVRHREDVRPGFARLPETLAALFAGTNNGTLIARISDGAGNRI